jgi:hypothetical protein
MEPGTRSGPIHRAMPLAWDRRDRVHVTRPHRYLNLPLGISTFRSKGAGRWKVGYSAPMFRARLGPPNYRPPNLYQFEVDDVAVQAFRGCHGSWHRCLFRVAGIGAGSQPVRKLGRTPGTEPKRAVVPRRIACAHEAGRRAATGWRAAFDLAAHASYNIFPEHIRARHDRHRYGRPEALLHALLE